MLENNNRETIAECGARPVMDLFAKWSARGAGGAPEAGPARPEGFINHENYKALFSGALAPKLLVSISKAGAFFMVDYCAPDSPSSFLLKKLYTLLFFIWNWSEILVIFMEFLLLCWLLFFMLFLFYESRHEQCLVYTDNKGWCISWDTIFWTYLFFQ